MDFSIKGFKYNEQIIPQIIKKLLASMCLVSHDDLKCKGKQRTECKVSLKLIEKNNIWKKGKICTFLKN